MKSKIYEKFTLRKIYVRINDLHTLRASPNEQAGSAVVIRRRQLSWWLCRPLGDSRRKKHREVNLTDKRKFWSKLAKWDDRVEREWIQWIELIAGLSALILLTLSLLAVWDGKSP